MQVVHVKVPPACHWEAVFIMNALLSSEMSFCKFEAYCEFNCSKSTQYCMKHFSMTKPALEVGCWSIPLCYMQVQALKCCSEANSK